MAVGVFPTVGPITPEAVAAGRRESIERSLKFKQDFEVEGSGANSRIGGRSDRQRHAEVMVAVDLQRRSGYPPAIVFNPSPRALLVNTGQTGYYRVPGATSEFEPGDNRLEDLEDPNNPTGFAAKWKGKLGIKILRGSGIDYPFDMKDMGGGNYVPTPISPEAMGKNAIREYPDRGVFVVEFQKAPPTIVNGKLGEVTYSAPLANIEALMELNLQELEGFMWSYYRKAESVWAQTNGDGAKIDPPWVDAADFLFQRNLIPKLPPWATSARSTINEYVRCYACGESISKDAAVCKSCTRVQPADEDERTQFAKLVRMGVSEPAALNPKKRMAKIEEFEGLPA
jgi:hypothetical protein